MARQIIDTTTNNGTYIGDPAKTAFEKTNSNFQEVYENFLDRRAGGVISATVEIQASGSSLIPLGSASRPFRAYVNSGNADYVNLDAYRSIAGTWEGLDWVFQREVDGTAQGGVAYRGGNSGVHGAGVALRSSGMDRWGVAGTGPFTPAIDNTYSLGSSALRPSVIYSATGSINTSDAREKTEVYAFNKSELKASIELSKKVGTYKFLSSIKEKGSLARIHIGLTVQDAIEIMSRNGLDPFSYGFICHDSWESSDEVVDINGDVVSEGFESGDRFGFRMDSLLMFIARGMEERLSLLENSTK